MIICIYFLFQTHQYSTYTNEQYIRPGKTYLAVEDHAIDGEGPSYTTDDYSIIKGRVQGNGETFPELGMREVFSRTCKNIQDKYGIKLDIPQLQGCLEKGEIWVTNIRNMTRTAVEFKDILKKNCNDVCHEALEKMKIVHNYFQDTEYIIGTGGTYDAWKQQFDEAFHGMQGLHIVPANINDPEISNVFSNARGYYFYLITRLKGRK